MLMDLAGKWEVWLENTEEEIPEKERPQRKPDGSVILPGILQAQGYGNPVIAVRWRCMQRKRASFILI